MFSKIEQIVSKDALELDMIKYDLNSHNLSTDELEKLRSRGIELETRVIKRRWIAGICTAVVVILVGLFVSKD